MRISYYTLGCKLNQAETNELKTELTKIGFLTVPWGSSTDIAIVRACGVTMGASQTTRELIRQAKRMGAYVVATGCLENSDLPEIDFGGQTNSAIITHLQKIKTSNFDQTYELCLSEPEDKTRAFIKIQNGCNFNCAYCIIPHFRGRASNITTDEVIKKITDAENNGYNEVVLTGVNVCLFKDGDTDLAGLLAKVLKKTKIQRIRLGSLDPRLIPDRLIALYQNPRLLPHMHLSLQSGSDAVLHNMRRGYTTAQYFDIVQRTRALYPLFSFTTDIIVGFPGETEKNFLETCAFVKQCQFAKVHVFPFSPRPGTVAANMKPAVQDKIKTERVKKLIRLANTVGKKYFNKFIGMTRPVLFESRRGDFWYGYTPEYIRAKQRTTKDLNNKIIDTLITVTK